MLSLPMTLTGKQMRRELRKRAEEETKKRRRCMAPKMGRETMDNLNM